MKVNTTTLIGCNSRIGKFNVGWALAKQSIGVIKQLGMGIDNQYIAILSFNCRIMLGQGPTYAVLFAYMRVAPTLINATANYTLMSLPFYLLGQMTRLASSYDIDVPKSVNWRYNGWTFKNWNAACP